MKNKHSLARQQYDYAYRFMRQGITFEQIEENPDNPIEIIKAADYSYQAFGCEPHGWSSHRRYRAFLHIKWRVLSRREELPF